MHRKTTTYPYNRSWGDARGNSKPLSTNPYRVVPDLLRTNKRVTAQTRRLKHYSNWWPVKAFQLSLIDYFGDGCRAHL